MRVCVCVRVLRWRDVNYFHYSRAAVGAGRPRRSGHDTQHFALVVDFVEPAGDVHDVDDAEIQTILTFVAPVRGARVFAEDVADGAPCLAGRPEEDEPERLVFAVRSEALRLPQRRFGERHP